MRSPSSRADLIRATTCGRWTRVSSSSSTFMRSATRPSQGSEAARLVALRCRGGTRSGRGGHPGLRGSPTSRRGRRRHAGPPDRAAALRLRRCAVGGARRQLDDPPGWRGSDDLLGNERGRDPVGLALAGRAARVGPGHDQRALRPGLEDAAVAGGKGIEDRVEGLFGGPRGRPPERRSSRPRSAWSQLPSACGRRSPRTWPVRLPSGRRPRRCSPRHRGRWRRSARRRQGGPRAPWRSARAIEPERRHPLQPLADLRQLDLVPRRAAAPAPRGRFPGPWRVPAGPSEPAHRP